MDQLEVPEETRRAYDRATIEVVLASKGIQKPSLNVLDNIVAIATPVVVAELRKIRDLVRNDPSLSGQDVAIYALERANDLEGWE